MFEIPEITVLSRQINQTLRGKIVDQANLGNSPHKFVWYNHTPAEFARLAAGKTVGEARPRGRWLLTALEPGMVLVFGECGGKLLYHAPGEKLPAKYHLWLKFDDGSSLTAFTQMWGAMELYPVGQELERPYIKDMRPTPADPEFTFEYFDRLVDTLILGEKRSVKGLLTQDQLIPGLGNSVAQDILFRARLHPRHAISQLDPHQRQQLFDSILTTVREVTDCGGRYDEIDLFGRPGGYVRQMDRHAAGNPCPLCGATIEAIQYLGGACYFCPRCQV